MDLQFNQMMTQGGPRGNRNQPYQGGQQRSQYGGNNYGGNQNIQPQSQYNNNYQQQRPQSQFSPQGGYVNRNKPAWNDNQQQQFQARSQFNNRQPRQQYDRNNYDNQQGGGFNQGFRNQMRPAFNQGQGYQQVNQSQFPNYNNQARQYPQQSNVRQYPQQSNVRQFDQGEQDFTQQDVGFQNRGGNQGFRSNIQNRRDNFPTQQYDNQDYNNRSQVYRPNFNQQQNPRPFNNRSGYGRNNFQNKGGQRDFRSNNNNGSYYNGYSNNAPKNLPPPQSVPVQPDNSIRIPQQNQSPFPNPNSLIISQSTRTQKPQTNHLDEFCMKGKKYEPRAERSSANQVFAFPQFVEQRGGKNEIPEFENVNKIKYSDFLRIGEQHERDILKNLVNTLKI